MCERTFGPGENGNMCGMSEQPVRFPIRFGALTPLFVLTGLTPRRFYVEVVPEVVRVRMGWSFSADVPRASIRSAHRLRDKRWSIGVHGWRGRWLVNGARGPLVVLEIAPPAHARVLGFRVRLRELIVSVEEADALIAALSSR
jgi:hypothetical protein